jgi:hypothetical protein
MTRSDIEAGADLPSVPPVRLRLLTAVSGVVGAGQASMCGSLLVAVAGVQGEGERGEEVTAGLSRITRSEQAFARAAQSAGLTAAIADIPEQRQSLPVIADGLLVASLAQIGCGETGQGPALLLLIACLAGESKRCGMTSAGLRVLVAGKQALANPVECVGFPAPVADLLEQRQGRLVAGKSLIMAIQAVAYPAQPDEGVSLAIPVAKLARESNVPLVMHDYLLVAALRVVIAREVGRRQDGSIRRRSELPVEGESVLLVPQT